MYEPITGLGSILGGLVPGMAPRQRQADLAQAQLMQTCGLLNAQQAFSLMGPRLGIQTEDRIDDPLGAFVWAAQNAFTTGRVTVVNIVEPKRQSRAVKFWRKLYDRLVRWWWMLPPHWSESYNR